MSLRTLSDCVQIQVKLEMKSFYEHFSISVNVDEKCLEENVLLSEDNFSRAVIKTTKENQEVKLLYKVPRNISCSKQVSHS